MEQSTALPTDEQLNARAEDLANERYPFPTDEPSFDTHLLQTGHSDATLDALKVDRESLRLLEEKEHDFDCEAFNSVRTVSLDTPLKPLVCNCGLNAHINLLKTRLGMTK